MKKFKIPIIILIILAVLMATQFFKTKARQKLSGTLEMTEHALGAPVPGRLATLLTYEGGLVEKGQTLATLDHFEQAQKDYKRLKDIQRTGGIDVQTVEHAYQNMTDHQIVSPVAGEVLVKVHEAGEVVAAGQAVVIVGDPSDRWVKVFVPEGKINQVKLGQPAML
jgi:HlyD family secretion protein